MNHHEYQNMWIKNREQEILANSFLLGNAIAAYATLSPSKVGQIVRHATFGTAGGTLDLDDLVMKAAEVQADDDWHKHVNEQIDRVTALMKRRAA